ncbi:BQ5605_C010g06107 [Microbotryum silenes-dioicae]|uniref:BQ5605_C010g06107 protein n=1 Tax=Microbotryum silenes-dioicae TaxID=796604 RepID=A0A2X0LV36_9BASI|nr:BQ5605_C010g06107 [Microbotryum silenes-dioicae]
MDRARIDKAVKEWLRLDRNPYTRQDVEALRDAGDYTELAKRFDTRIAFGTAGLRARMQAGTSSMNDLVVLQATQGLASYVKEHVPNALSRGAVIGHDHRSFGGLNSKRFAQLAAGVFQRGGYRVYLFEGLIHTPMVPFALSKLGAAVGLMVTASHNPAADNGYKVYWENGVQIIPPHDHGIAKRIDESLEVDEAAWDVDPANFEWRDTEALKDDYIAMTTTLIDPKIGSGTATGIVYTAMHGVGRPFAQRAFTACGFDPREFIPVESQAEPDPTFPTVKFPNPEEKGALDEAMKKADQVGSQIVVANDPDADRFCAAEKVGATWNAFTGDQLGTLLGAWVLHKYKASGKPIDKLAMCASAVSSKMLKTIAEKEGFVFCETLTGFKYLGNECLTWEAKGYEPLFAYEEAIGYLHGSVVRDKDGVTALVSFCELVAYLASIGKTPSSWLDELYNQYGFFKTSNSYFICRDSKKTDRIFSKLRFGTEAPPTTTKEMKAKLNLPKLMSGYPVVWFRDLTIGYDSANAPSFEPSLPVDEKSHMISFKIGGEDGVEVVGTVRTSGTEPKIKFYLEGSGADRHLVGKKLQQVREALGVEWLGVDPARINDAVVDLTV